VVDPLGGEHDLLGALAGLVDQADLVGDLDAVDGAVVVVEHPLAQDLVAVGVLEHLLAQQPGARSNHRVLSRAGCP
jgi:hypothetical protein